MTNEAELLEAAAKGLRDGEVEMPEAVAQALAELLSQVAGIVRQPPGVGRPDGPAGRTLNVACAILGPGWAMQQAAADLASIEQDA